LKLAAIQREDWAQPFALVNASQALRRRKTLRHQIFQSIPARKTMRSTRSRHIARLF
jgi:hypothetical protein